MTFSLLFLFFISLSSSGAALDLSTIVTPLLPAFPFVPFFPVTAADFSKRDTPASFLREQGPSQTTRQPPVLLCLGDSLTHGSVSANWVDRIALRLPSFTVLNAGINSETASAVRVRLDEIVAVQPAMVTVLIGSNDLIGSLDKWAARMYKLRLWNKQKESPCLDAYRRELSAIIRELDERLDPTTRIAVLSPPPLGEGMDGIAWKEGAKMAKVCSEVCGLSSARVSYLPLYEVTRKEMVKVLLGNEDREFDFWDVLPFVSVVVPWQLLLGMPFSDIMEANGYQFTLDGVHFGEEFATVVEDLVYDWTSQLSIN